MQQHLLALTHFPTALPDESVMGMCARYQVLAVHCSARESLRALFGRGMPVTSSNLPTYVGLLADRLPPDIGLTAEEIIEHHTHLPYYRPFRTATTVAGMIRAMLGRGGSNAKAVGGLLSGRVGASDPLRYCPICRDADLQRYGVAYWHREHLLPGVLVCAHHEVGLRQVDPPIETPARHGFSLPPAEPVEDRHHADLADGLDEAAIDAAVAIARISRDILWSATPSLAARDTARAYRAEVARRGWMTAGGRVRQAPLQERVLEHYHGLSATPPYGRLLGLLDAAETWLATIVRGRRAGAHPLKHILLIAFLYTDWPAFLRATREQVPYSPPEPGSGAENASPPAGPALLRHLVLVEGHSLRSAAEVLGTTVTTLSVRASRYEIPLSRTRPVKHRPAGERRARRLLRRGVPMQDVMAATGYSRAHLGRILRGNPQLRYRRQHSLMRRARRRHRADYTAARTADPEASATEIRRRVPAAYAWLYAHDREWLWAHSPAPARATPPETRVDWARRDRELAVQVVEAADAIRTRPGRPVRVSPSTVGRMIGALTLLQHRRDMLPRTARVLETVGESVEDYQVRRIEWARAELVRLGIPPAAWRIQRLAGIGCAPSARVRAAIREAAGQMAIPGVPEIRRRPTQANGGGRG
ncbi:TnsD family Tn7-like transposition protein [Deferrisoma palaeochoriense]